MDWSSIWEDVYYGRLIESTLVEITLEPHWKTWNSKDNEHGIENLDGLRFVAWYNSRPEGHRILNCNQFFLDCLKPEHLESFKMWLDEKEVQEL